VGNGGRHASLCKQIVLVVEKQLVIHLQTLRQKTDIGFMIAWGGLHMADPYRRIRAGSQRAKVTQRWGGRPIPRGERRRIVASTVLATVYLLEKWDLGSKEGVKIKPSHLRRACG